VIPRFCYSKKTRKNSCKSSWLTTNMIVAYDLLVIEEVIPSTYMEVEISSKSKMGKDVIMEVQSPRWERMSLWKR